MIAAIGVLSSCDKEFKMVLYNFTLFALSSLNCAAFSTCLIL